MHVYIYIYVKKHACLIYIYMYIYICPGTLFGKCLGSDLGSCVASKTVAMDP